MVLRYCLLNQSPQATGTRWYRTSTLAGVTVESKRVTSRGQKFTTSTSEKEFTEDHDPGSQWNTCCQVRDP